MIQRPRPPSPILSPTDPVPRGLLTLRPWARCARCVTCRANSQALTGSPRGRLVPGACRHTFSKVLSIVSLYSKCTRSLTFQNVHCRHRFSKVLSVVPLYSKCTRSLTFQNVHCSFGRGGIQQFVLDVRYVQASTRGVYVTLVVKTRH